jgi:hypothetical protein
MAARAAFDRLVNVTRPGFPCKAENKRTCQRSQTFVCLFHDATSPFCGFMALHADMTWHRSSRRADEI